MFVIPAWRGQAFPEASQGCIWECGGDPTPPAR